MPLYEYICKKCQSEFEFLTQGSEVAVCPQCQGQDLKKKFSIFATATVANTELPCAQACSGGCSSGKCPMEN